MSDPLKKFSNSTFPGGTGGRLNSGLGGTAAHNILSTSDPLPLLLLLFSSSFYSVQQSVLDFEGHYFLLPLFVSPKLLAFFLLPSCPLLPNEQSMRDSVHFVSSLTVGKSLREKYVIVKLTHIYLQDFQTKYCLTYLAYIDLKDKFWIFFNFCDLDVFTSHFILWILTWVVDKMVNQNMQPTAALSSDVWI